MAKSATNGTKKTGTKSAKAEKAPKVAKAEKQAAQAAAKPAPAIFNSELDQEEKQLFLHHLPKVKAARAAVAKATVDLRNLYKKAKSEGGFEKADFDTAIELETAEAEAKARAKIARKLKIAKIVGSTLGAQLDMFMEPDRTPAAEIAFEEGRTAAMSNEPARPKYDPSTEQHRRYMDGFHSVTEQMVTQGIGKLEPEGDKAPAKPRVAKVKAMENAASEPQGEQEAEPAPLPTSGVPMTRAQFKRQQEEAAAQAGRAAAN